MYFAFCVIFNTSGFYGSHSMIYSEEKTAQIYSEAKTEQKLCNFGAT